MPIPAIRAAQAAADYLQHLLPLAGESIEDRRLEEVEISEDEQRWLVTLGYNVLIKTPVLANPLLNNGNPPRYERIYKLFRVDATTGNVQSMKIRQV